MGRGSAAQSPREGRRDDGGDMITTQRTRRAAHVWLNCSTRADGAAMSYASSKGSGWAGAA
eukprot:128539-Prymnesium_polylepis.1